MRLRELSIENFRGIRKFEFVEDFEFDNSVNVFFGINGVGKSSVLNSINIGLSWIIAKIKGNNSRGKYIDERDVLNGANYSNLAFKIEDSRKRIYSFKVNKNVNGYKNQNYAETKELTELNRFISSSSQLLPVLAYYPVTRSVIKIPLSPNTKIKTSPINVYDNSLSGNANFTSFFEWYRNQEDLENEKKRDNGNYYEDNQLRVVKEAIEKVVSGFTNLRVRRESQSMVIEKDGYEINVEQLSDGEKCLIALIGDLSRRLAIVNNHSSKPLEGEGIILIDEIDLHLHPEWQRKIIPLLKETFPNCQFFISTHSPLVLNNLTPNNLYSLTNNGYFEVSSI